MVIQAICGPDAAVAEVVKVKSVIADATRYSRVFGMGPPLGSTDVSPSLLQSYWQG
jgi:hypothetical protein